jgi:hypothetical protein
MPNENGCLGRREAQVLAGAMITIVQTMLRHEKRHETCTSLTTAYCEALIKLYPELARDGSNILEIMSEMVKRYPPESAVWDGG